jgi:hypothetical protein
MPIHGAGPAAIGAAVILLATGAVATPRASAAAPASPASCCFTNSRYAGVCEVRPESGETCASIRSYLNDPRSLGKLYCNSTSVRMGWKQVRCATPAPSPTPRR